MITRFGEGCWNLWWMMTANDGVWVVILGLVEIVRGIRVSHKIEGVFALARVVTYPQMMCLRTLFIRFKPNVVLGEQVT